jgi:hypothetical protein
MNDYIKLNRQQLIKQKKNSKFICESSRQREVAKK